MPESHGAEPGGAGGKIGPHSAEARYAGRIGRHATAYGAASLTTIVSGLATVVVYTRFLDTTEFGKLAVLLSIASMVTVIANLGSLQGTMRRVYGSSGDEDGADIDGDQSDISSDPRLALTTGLFLTCLAGGVLVLLTWAWSETFSGLIVGSGSDRDLLLLAVGAGAVAAVMRLARNMLRLQLRSVAYLVVSAVFALGSTAIAIPLLVAGLGITAIMIGTIAANVLASALSVFLLRRDVRAAVSISEGASIMRSGISYLPIVFSFQTLQIADTLFVAGLADFKSAGLYRVGQRVAQPVSYGTSVFQQAWGPMRYDLTQAAVDVRDADLTITARLITYYAVFVGALVLTITVFAAQLVQLAASEYESASVLIPLTSLSVAGHGWFVLAYRTSRLQETRFWLNVFSVTVAFTFVVTVAALVPPIGAAGAPIAAIVAWGVGTLGMVILSQRRAEPIPFEYRNLLLVLGSALGAGILGYLLLPDEIVGVLGGTVILAAWGVLLVLAKVVPLAELRRFLDFARHSWRQESNRRLQARIRDLRGLEATLVEEVVKREAPIVDVARRCGLSEEEVLSRTVQVLRSVANGGKPRATDLELGRVILIDRPTAEKDLTLLRMATKGDDPIDMDLIARAASAARGFRV